METKIKIEDLPTVYDAKSTEEKMYKFWEDGEYFKANAKSNKPPHTIVIPPPNVTGVLHMGHALDGTLQDILTRYYRMAGYEALWLPGTDHAGLATQNVVERELMKEGLTRHDLGREKFVEKTWEWANEHKSAILNQFKRLGASFDRSRERFTFDKGCSDAVKEVFVTLYNKGLIYKGAYIVNWCPRCMSAISDIETEYETEQGHMWEISYPLVGEAGAIIVATTRPETMFGDTCIAVHPSDKKYSELIGKKVMIPLSGRQIPIIADEYVDKSFGTGAVKITPAHDPNDYEVGKRHNQTPIWVIDEEGKMKACGEVPQEYHGLDRYEARKKIVEMLSYNNFLLRIKDHEHNVGKCQRCNTTIEPLLSEQWFVKMEPLAKEAIAAVKDGRIKFIPERWEKNYLGWMENIRDWCISRQLWWGHQIPAFYCDDCGEMIVTKENEPVCPKCGKKMRQDPDTLDTWFSSALWPFSTLGWPNETEEMDYFYPTSTLVTGYDIIPFWVMRMMFSGLKQTGKVPFDTVLIHGLVRDSLGRKMSKSLGNGIDPLEIIDSYGADALRFTLITGNAPGNDMRFYNERVEASRNFANKVWNASRFIMMNLPDEGIDLNVMPELTDADKWIVSSLNDVIKDVTDNLDKYELGIAADKIYNFIWEQFCDWYIEMVKPRLWNDEDETKAAALWTLKMVLTEALKLLHPYMPFVTEEIYCTLMDDSDMSIMVSDWPVYKTEYDFAEEKASVERIKEAVKGIRNMRSQMNVPPSRKSAVYVVSQSEEVRSIFENNKVFFAALGYANNVVVTDTKDDSLADAVSILIHEAAIYIPFAELVDVAKEIERLTNEQKKLAGELARSEKMLSNEKFISKAPQSKIDEEIAKQKKYQDMMNQVTERLEALTK